MMDLSRFAYDVCRSYVLDQQDAGQVDSVLLSRTLGWVRSRSLSHLCTLDSHFGSQAYSSEANCRFVRQVSAFFKKNKAFYDRRVATENARLTFEKGELLCRNTNKRLDYYLADHEDRLDNNLAVLIERARVFVHDTLGPLSDHIAEIPHLARVTSGATATRPRSKAMAHLKVSLRNTPVGKYAAPLYKHLAAEFGYDGVTTVECNYNRVTTVPKNYKTDRTIACEPDGNMPFQLAFDTYVKTRLRTRGIDLSCQQRNNDLAKEASIDNSLATVDLSMASDTLAINAVVALLPHEWSKYLTMLRSPEGRGFGKTYVYAKFASMGNGSTFPLETLIFSALIYAVKGDLKDCSVYGDDIILPKGLYPTLTTLLKFFGFSVNHEKSFVEGPFRESCGGDWYRGANVTPFYLRSKTKGKPEVCLVVNQLAAIAQPEGRLWNLLKTTVSEEDLPIIPFSESETAGVWIDIPTAYATKKLVNQFGRLQTTAFTSKVRKSFVGDSRALFLWHLDAGRRETHAPTVKKPWPDPIERSWTTHVKTRRKLVSWHMPARVAPSTLYWWTNYLIAS